MSAITDALAVGVDDLRDELAARGVDVRAYKTGWLINSNLIFHPETSDIALLQRDGQVHEARLATFPNVTSLAFAIIHISSCGKQETK